jgi:hypothetical protein
MKSPLLPFVVNIEIRTASVGECKIEEALFNAVEILFKLYDGVESAANNFVTLPGKNSKSKGCGGVSCANGRR